MSFEKTWLVTKSLFNLLKKNTKKIKLTKKDHKSLYTRKFCVNKVNEELSFIFCFTPF